jgi:hypothetical protein
LSYFNETRIFKEIFEKFSNIKFHENPSSGSRGVACGQMDRQTDMMLLIAACCHFVNAPENDKNLQVKYFIPFTNI